VGFIEEATKGMAVLVGESGMFGRREWSSNASLLGLLVAITPTTTDLCPIGDWKVSQFEEMDGNLC
jgi:hypothetical protein